MKTFLLAILCCTAPILFGKTKPWGVEELRRRLEVRGEIFLTDLSGKVVLNTGAPSSLWKTSGKSGRIENRSTSREDDYVVALKQVWVVNDDGTLSATIEQFAEAEDDTNEPDKRKPIKKIQKTIENLEPITFVAATLPNYKVVVRLTPGFEAGESPASVSEVIMSGTDVAISDNMGFAWANHVSQQGRYTGFATHRGTLFLSYYPFSGGHEAGVASGNEIRVHLSEKYVVTLNSKTAYLPQGMQAKVYAAYYPDRKTSGVGSISVMDRAELEKFNEDIKHWPK